MLTGIAIIPSAPVLVPAVAGAAAADLTDLRRAVIAAAATLPDRWVAVGVGDTDVVIAPDRTGTFAGYGRDVSVRLSPTAHVAGELPLCALIAGWVRGETRPTAMAQVGAYAVDHGVDAAIAAGRALRAEIDAMADPVGVLVVADGAHTLSPRAPGGYDPASAAVQAALDDALAEGDLRALAGLPDSITGRVAWQVLAGLAEPAPRSTKELHRSAPFGVGYFVGVWQP